MNSATISLYGLAFGVGITTADWLELPFHGWVFVIAKLVLLSVLIGCVPNGGEAIE